MKSFTPSGHVAKAVEALSNQGHSLKRCVIITQHRTSLLKIPLQCDGPEVEVLSQGETIDAILSHFGDPKESLQVLPYHSMRTFLRDMMWKLPLDKYRPANAPDKYLDQLLSTFSLLSLEGTSPERYQKWVNDHLPASASKELVEHHQELSTAYALWCNFEREYGIGSPASLIRNACALTQQHTLQMDKLVDFRDVFQNLVLDSPEKFDGGALQALVNLFGAAIGQSNITKNTTAHQGTVTLCFNSDLQHTSRRNRLYALLLEQNCDLAYGRRQGELEGNTKGLGTPAILPPYRWNQYRRNEMCKLGNDGNTYKDLETLKKSGKATDINKRISEFRDRFQMDLPFSKEYLSELAVISLRGSKPQLPKRNPVKSEPIMTDPEPDVKKYSQMDERERNDGENLNHPTYGHPHAFLSALNVPASVSTFTASTLASTLLTSFASENDRSRSDQMAPFRVSLAVRSNADILQVMPHIYNQLREYNQKTLASHIDGTASNAQSYEEFAVSPHALVSMISPVTSSIQASPEPHMLMALLHILASPYLSAPWYSLACNPVFQIPTSIITFSCESAKKNKTGVVEVLRRLAEKHSSIHVGENSIYPPSDTVNQQQANVYKHKSTPSSTQLHPRTAPDGAELEVDLPTTLWMTPTVASNLLKLVSALDKSYEILLLTKSATASVEAFALASGIWSTLIENLPGFKNSSERGQTLANSSRSNVPFGLQAAIYLRAAAIEEFLWLTYKAERTVVAPHTLSALRHTDPLRAPSYTLESTFVSNGVENLEIVNTKDGNVADSKEHKSIAGEQISSAPWVEEISWGNLGTFGSFFSVVPQSDSRGAVNVGKVASTVIKDEIDQGSGNVSLSDSHHDGHTDGFLSFRGRFSSLGNQCRWDSNYLSSVVELNGQLANMTELMLPIWEKARLSFQVFTQPIVPGCADLAPRIPFYASTPIFAASNTDDREKMPVDGNQELLQLPGDFSRRLAQSLAKVPSEELIDTPYRPREHETIGPSSNRHSSFHLQKSLEKFLLTPSSAFISQLLELQGDTELPGMSRAVISQLPSLQVSTINSLTDVVNDYLVMDSFVNTTVPGNFSPNYLLPLPCELMDAPLASGCHGEENLHSIVPIDRNSHVDQQLCQFLDNLTNVTNGAILVTPVSDREYWSGKQTKQIIADTLFHDTPLVSINPVARKTADSLTRRIGSQFPNSFDQQSPQDSNNRALEYMPRDETELSTVGAMNHPNKDVGPLRLSFSAVSDYAWCPYKYKLGRIDLVPSRLHLGYGSGLHAALALWAQMLGETLLQVVNVFGSKEAQQVSKTMVPSTEIARRALELLCNDFSQNGIRARSQLLASLPTESIAKNIMLLQYRIAFSVGDNRSWSVLNAHNGIITTLLDLLDTSGIPDSELETFRSSFLKMSDSVTPSSPSQASVDTISVLSDPNYFATTAFESPVEVDVDLDSEHFQRNRLHPHYPNPAFVRSLYPDQQVVLLEDSAKEAIQRAVQDELRTLRSWLSAFKEIDELLAASTVKIKENNSSHGNLSVINSASDFAASKRIFYDNEVSPIMYDMLVEKLNSTWRRIDSGEVPAPSLPLFVEKHFVFPIVSLPLSPSSQLQSNANISKSDEANGYLYGPDVTKESQKALVAKLRSSSDSTEKEVVCSGVIDRVDFVAWKPPVAEGTPESSEPSSTALSSGVIIREYKSSHHWKKNSSSLRQQLKDSLQPDTYAIAIQSIANEERWTSGLDALPLSNWIRGPHYSGKMKLLDVAGTTEVDAANKSIPSPQRSIKSTTKKSAGSTALMPLLSPVVCMESIELGTQVGRRIPEKQMKEAKKAMANAAKDILDGHFPATPSAIKCTYCPYSSVCRYAFDTPELARNTFSEQLYSKPSTLLDINGPEMR